MNQIRLVISVTDVSNYYRWFYSSAIEKFYVFSQAKPDFEKKIL